jgi:hypothetical protein
MRLYHQTDFGEAIMREGFRDGMALGYTDDGEALQGVWLASFIAGAAGEGMELLSVQIPDAIAAGYEVQGEGEGEGVYYIPAEVVNRYEIEDWTDLDERDDGDRRNGVWA